MYGQGNIAGQSFANGVIMAYWVKVVLVSYLIAYHQFGFRLPSLPFDIAYLVQVF